MPRSKTLKKKRPSNEIFIVFQMADEGLAGVLKNLMELWGFDTYYCNQQERDIEIYREELGNKLVNAKLVIILASKSFLTSPYCQAEAGITAALKKKTIVVAVPPVRKEEIGAIVPVLDGYWVRELTEPDFLDRIKADIKKRIKRSAKQQTVEGREKEADLSRKLNEIVIDRFALPQTIGFKVFSKPALEGLDHPACRNIIRTIKDRLSDSSPITKLAFVGVSLKFSLRLITEALNEFVSETKLETRKKPASGKSLQIELVYMDDQSYILHALPDTTDLKHIRDNFCGLGINQQVEWEVACQSVNISLVVPSQFRIDYVPPRVGILIGSSEKVNDSSCVLYVGRCAFGPDGAGFRLLVGELEYFFYTANDREGKAAIAEFRDFLSVYKTSYLNNGIFGVPQGNVDEKTVPRSESSAWIGYLEDYIIHHSGIKKITTVSISGSKFCGIVALALENHIDVDVYLQSSFKAPQFNRGDIENFGKRLQQHLTKKVSCEHDGVARIFYYKNPCSFRAVLLDDVALGVQMYVRPINSDGGRKLWEAGPLPLIVPKSSWRYRTLRKNFFEHFLATEGVGNVPAFTVQNGEILMNQNSPKKGRIKSGTRRSPG